MATYTEALARLNDAQKQAVLTTEGPVLVIAGPGTGKTQLLTTRIAHILATTDTLPQNILCLTFTESAAHTMRERLANFIGQDAYDVTISTYHAFGSDLIRRFPDYFTALSGQKPVDDLGADTIFRAILEDLPYTNPLKLASQYVSDIRAFVSDAKRALLTPDDLRAIAQQNQEFIMAASPLAAQTLQNVSRISKTAIPYFEQLLALVQPLVNITPAAPSVTPLSQLFASELAAAVQEALDSGKTPSITKWKNAWLARDANNQFTVEGLRTCFKLRAAADVYGQYLARLHAEGLFDYDDMILQAVRTLEQNDDLRFTLQEQYLYIMLDEFQDTNGAQLRLVELLTNNPASEGRPNVLAVGDDDQAIYAFQGADYSHMLQFQKLYRDVLVVPLTKNYRSHADILHTAQNIAGQIEQRLHHHFPDIQKTLSAENPSLPERATIERREAKSDVAQFAWVAQQVKSLIAQGIPANEIAVLAPQHKHLEPLVPFLRQHQVAVRYEKREDVLEDPAIVQLLRMSELIEALRLGQHERSNSLWAEILSFDFWNLPTSRIWQLSWQANDERENWTDALLQHDDIKPIALFFVRLSLIARSETLETMLDYLIGTTPLDLHEPGQEPYRSPFYAYYFSALEQETSSTVQQVSLQQALEGASATPSAPLGTFWQLLTHLTVLRSRLREYKAQEAEPLYLADFIAFVEAHRAANIKILNTSPYQDHTDAVQLMTAFKSKGMEFSAVFVLAVNDEVWGSKARTQSARLSLPPNLQFIRYAGATNDERLRLFYVALTRAKTHLYLVNYTADYAGKQMTRLKYLDETTDGTGLRSRHLPEAFQAVLPAEEGQTPLPAAELAAYWQQRHQAALGQPDLRVLLQERLAHFQLSPTHVGMFIDLLNAGPAAFFMNVLLRFPRAPLPQGEFGNAMHETLEWIHMHNRRQGQLPHIDQALEAFDLRLKAKRLTPQQTEQLGERGHIALEAYLVQRTHTIHADDECEYNFRNEGVFIGPAHMSGKIDKLIIDKQAKTITIVDYKTGRGFACWQHDPKLHKYEMQLYLYKLLVEGSHQFSDYTVTDAYLEFVEPDEEGTIQELHIDFDETETNRLKDLVAAVWQCIQQVHIPNTTGYDLTYTGVLAFEQDLIASLSAPAVAALSV